MASEQSFADRAQRARQLHASVTGLSPAYAPADPKFSLPAFQTAITGAERASQTIDTAKVPFDESTAGRIALVKSLGPLVTHALAYVKSNSAWEKKFPAIKDAADKVRGVRPARKPVPASASGTEQKKARQQGERSYAEIEGFFRKFVDRVTALTGYQPPDFKISVLGLEETRGELEDLNRALPILESAYDDAVGERSEAYIGAQGLKSAFDGVKLSVKGQYGQTSPQYRSISGMRW